jgi:heat-inducible transcriptional repressor
MAMAEELNERGRKILEAIIEDYIVSAEPVGSRAVARRHHLPLSPATVRNVMADLEEMGYITSPHTSAGRVPTEKGYRFYVDSLLQVRQLSRAEQLHINQYYRPRGLRVDELLQEAGKALSAISNYTGIVMAPRLIATTFRHIEFIRLSQGRMLVVFVTQSGLVQNKLIENSEDLSQPELEQIANYLNRTLGGLTIQQVKARIVEEMAQEKALYDQLLRQALRLSEEALRDEPGHRIYIEGTSNILDQPEFADLERMKKLFRTFEQKSVLIDLLERAHLAGGVQIFIGSESQFCDIEGCSLITAAFSNSRGTLGTLGVIGPSRMFYSQVIPIVDYTARLVSQLLDFEEK